MRLVKSIAENPSSPCSVITGTSNVQACEEEHSFYHESLFRHHLKMERMRTERSKKTFLLLLIDISRLIHKLPAKNTVAHIKAALKSSLREIDVRGWYHNDHTIGIIISNVSSDENTATDTAGQKVYARFCDKIDPQWIAKISLSFFLFPETNSPSLSDNTFNSHLFPELTRHSRGKAVSLTMKRCMDILGSLIALIIVSPLFLVIAAAIKATSAGPVFFRQERVGFRGKTFAMLKFRSMSADCDQEEHRTYIKKIICEQKEAAVEPGVFKLTQDKRITRIGRLLRKTSLDELPQFINVLRGEMSLVGPRPPIPYECELYDIWHCRRLFSCKPGITGLWQVTGRSRTTFDEMVRLDLQYIREWDLALDCKILFMTPKAVLSGTGAF